MTRHYAFLRAINVTGRRVKMAHLKDVVGELDVAKVESFIASGNLIFDATTDDVPGLEAEIAAHLETRLGYPVPTFLRTRRQLQRVVRHEPFGDRGPDDAFRVAFLHRKPTRGIVEELAVLQPEVDRIDLTGRELYWLYRKDRGESRFSGARVERILGAPMTGREVETVRRLIDRSG